LSQKSKINENRVASTRSDPKISYVISVELCKFIDRVLYILALVISLKYHKFAFNSRIYTVVVKLNVFTVIHMHSIHYIIRTRSVIEEVV
jgi:hypothetical protein